MKRVLALVGLLLTSLLLPGAAGAQETGAQSGWWTHSPLPPPDVGEDELLVQGSPDPETPIAYAAVSIPLPLEALPDRLTLTVAPESATTPNATLVVCPLTTTFFEPASGGAAADGPEYSCDTSVEAAPSADGATYEFDVAALTAFEALAVAILPTAPTDRVVLAVPSADALATTSAGSGSDTGTSGFGDSSGGSDGGSTFGTGSSPSGSTFDAPAPAGPVATGGTAFQAPETPAAAAPGQAPAETEPAADETGGGQQLAAQPVSSDSGGGRSFAPFAFAGLLLAAGTLWGFAGQPTDGEGEPA